MTGADELRELRENWDRLGRDDPLCAVLTENSRRGGRWDRDEFMATGHNELSGWLSWIEELGLPLRGEQALDFGCGVGRMTQALARHFRSVIGLDIAPSMIALAEEMNKNTSVRFVHHDRPNLSLFPDRHFDFVFSVLVLQHVRPEFTRQYLHEIARVLAPGGVLAFQLPGEPQPIPDSVFSNHLAFHRTPPHRLSPGERVTICVRVTNTSPLVWSLSQVYALGNHWRQDDQPLRWDDGRAWIPTLTPGESAIVDLEVTAPAEPGHVALEVDLVAEGVAWFGERGCSTIESPVVVEGGATGGAAHIRTEAPTIQMEMHCIPSSEVIRLLRREGFDLVDSRLSNRSAAWIDYCYVARRSARPVASPIWATTAREEVAQWLRQHLPVSVKRAIRVAHRALGHLHHVGHAD